MSTRNIIPRSDGEGSIGIPNLQWSSGVFGNISLNGSDLQSVLDSKVNSGELPELSADNISFVPSGGLVSSDVQSAVLELDGYFSNHTGDSTIHVESGQKDWLDNVLVSYTETNYLLGASGNIQDQLDTKATKADLAADSVVFVSADKGNDSTAVREDPTKPFKTLKAAENAASPGDTIWVGPGTYNFSSAADTLDKLNIKWWFEDGAIINVTENVGTASPIFYLSGESSTPGEEFYHVDGYLRVEGNNYICCPLYVNYFTGNIYFKCQSILNINATGNAAIFIHTVFGGLPVVFSINEISTSNSSQFAFLDSGNGGATTSLLIYIGKVTGYVYLGGNTRFNSDNPVNSIKSYVEFNSSNQVVRCPSIGTLDIDTNQSLATVSIHTKSITTISAWSLEGTVVLKFYGDTDNYTELGAITLLGEMAFFSVFEFHLFGRFKCGNLLVPLEDYEGGESESTSQKIYLYNAVIENSDTMELAPSYVYNAEIKSIGHSTVKNMFPLDLIQPGGTIELDPNLSLS